MADMALEPSALCLRSPSSWQGCQSRAANYLCYLTAVRQKQLVPHALLQVTRPPHLALLATLLRVAMQRSMRSLGCGAQGTRFFLTRENRAHVP